MRTLSADTTPEAESLMLELLRQSPVWKRLQMVDQIHETLRQLIMADLRRTHPHADETELGRRLVARLLNREEVVAAYGWDPKTEGYSYIDKG